MGIDILFSLISFIPTLAVILVFFVGYKFVSSKIEEIKTFLTNIKTIVETIEEATATEETVETANPVETTTESSTESSTETPVEEPYVVEDAGGSIK